MYLPILMRFAYTNPSFNIEQTQSIRIYQFGGGAGSLLLRLKWTCSYYPHRNYVFMYNIFIIKHYFYKKTFEFDAGRIQNHLKTV